MALMKDFIRREELIEREALSALFAVNVIIIAALILPAKLQQAVNAAETVPAPWIFAGVQFLLKYLPPPLAGVILPGSLILIFLFFPYLAKSKPTAAKTLLSGSLIVTFFLTLLGHFTAV